MEHERSAGVPPIDETCAYRGSGAPSSTQPVEGVDRAPPSPEGGERLGAAPPSIKGGERLGAAPPSTEAPDRALALAFRHLGRRDRSVAEVRRHLERHGLASEAIEGAVAELEHQGYLDDAAYARRFAEDRRARDGWGAERITRSLHQAGIDSELVATALAAPVLGDELDAALALLRRRLDRPPASDRERERALGLLARRGFELEIAYDAVRAFERGADGGGHL